jgi:molecular chaperone DnaJ
MALTPEDIARILGVPVDADHATVTRAYRELALRYHPDQHGDDAEAQRRLAELNEAYASWCAARPGAASTGTAPPPTIDLDAIFSQFFGAAAARAPATNGRDLTQPLRLAPSEAQHGTRRVVDFTRPVPCEPCSGSGARDGVLRPCPACRATGRLDQTVGFVQLTSSCAMCSGTGRLAVDRCRVCDGRGERPSAESITVTVPPGVRAGMMLRIPGKGGGHATGPAGDLFLEIVITDELARFVRQGDDALIDVPVGARHLLLGGALEVPTLDGKSTVRVPRGVGDGHTVRLTGRGYPRSAASSPPASTGASPYREAQVATGRGDQVVVFRVAPGTRLRARLTVAAAAVATAGTAAAILFG